MPGRRLSWLVIAKLFSHQKVTASYYLVSRELLRTCEFGVGPSGSDGEPGQRQRDHKVESDISLTRVTFHFQPCKCLFAKNRTPCSGLHLVWSLRCACVYERETGALVGRILPFFCSYCWLLWSMFKFEKSNICTHSLTILVPVYLWSNGQCSNQFTGVSLPLIV